MSEIINNLNNQFIQRILIILVVSLLSWAAKWLRLKYLKSKYHFVIGNWIGYYLTSDNSFVKQKITIYPRVLGKLKIKIVEQTTDNYLYNGILDIIENNIFAYLSGKNHPGKSFLTIKIPFNRKESVSTLNGIFSGVNQENKPVSVKIVWSRFDLNLNNVKSKLGNKKKYLKVPDND